MNPRHKKYTFQTPDQSGAIYFLVRKIINPNAERQLVPIVFALMEELDEFAISPPREKELFQGGKCLKGKSLNKEADKNDSL